MIDPSAQELAYKEEQRAKTGYEDTRCEICDSKVGPPATHSLAG